MAEGWTIVYAEGQERAHLIADNEVERHEASEDCECRPIPGEVMPRHESVWVHGLR